MTLLLADKIKELKNRYDDPDDQEIVKEWEDKLQKINKKSKYFKLEETRNLTAYIQKRIKDIKISLAETVGLEKDKNIAMHARRQELESILKIISEDSEKDLVQLESEIDVELSR